MDSKRGPEPTLRALWLGQQLRELREIARLTLKEAGDYIQRDASTVSRIESGHVPGRVPDVLELLNLYGVDDGNRRGALEKLSRDVWQKGWWDGYAGHVAGTLMDYTWLEERACQVRSFDPLVIPGLLQTREYAEAVIGTASLAASNHQVWRWVEFRMTRQQVLDKEEPLHLSTVLDEGILRRPGGNADVMRAQLAHLIEMTKRPGIEIRVLPFRSGVHVSPDGAFSILDLRDPFPEVAYVETPAGAIYVETPNTERFVTMYDRLQGASLDPDESAELISAAMTDMQ